MAKKSLTFDIFGRDKSASKTLRGIGGAADDMGAKFKKVSAGIALGVGAVLAGIGKIAVDSVQALIRIERLGAQTESVIKSTGGAANVTAEHVAKLADALEKTTTTEAESVQEGANLLLTFKNIRNEAGKGNQIFDRATAIMVDMARALGTEAKDGALQLGKALNDPVKGIAALSRVGITFTKAQEDVIRSLVESGDAMGAQKIMLAELQSQFGGSGAAYMDTFAGRIDNLSNRWGDVGEKILTEAMPALEDLMEFSETELIPALEDLSGWFVDDGLPAIEGFVGWVNEYKDVLGPAAAAVGGLTIAQWLLNAAMLANPFGLIVLGITLVIAQVAALIINFETVFKAVFTFGQAVSGFASSITIGIVSMVEGMANAVIKGINDMLVPLNFVRSLLGQPTIELSNVDLTSGLKRGAAAVAANDADTIWSLTQGAGGGSFRQYHGSGGGSNSGRGHYTLAEGALVKKRPGGIFANIGEGRHDEVVLPLSPDVMSQLTGHGGSWVQNIYPAAGMSEETIGQVAANSLNRRLRGA